MKKYSKDVWMMARDILLELGGDNNWIQLGDIVNGVRNRWANEDVVAGTIRCQVRMRCVNGHPGHDEYPDKGKMWKEQPTFVSNKSGKYRLYNKERDYEIYIAALAEDGISPNEIMPKKAFKIIIPPPPNLPPVEVSSANININDPIGLLEKYGKQLGFQTQREWPVPMGRIDLVWYKEISIMLPQTVTRKYPLIGFKIETSWRTRKHIKGDIQNLQALKAPLGIILQQTSLKDYTNDVANLIRTVRDFLKELGVNNILVWTDEDLIKLGKEIV